MKAIEINPHFFAREMVEILAADIYWQPLKSCTISLSLTFLMQNSFIQPASQDS